MRSRERVRSWRTERVVLQFARAQPVVRKHQGVATVGFPYFANRCSLATGARNVNSNEKRPFTEYLSPEARERLARSRDEVLKEHWGPDRFEAYRARL